MSDLSNLKPYTVVPITEDDEGQIPLHLGIYFNGPFLAEFPLSDRGLLESLLNDAYQAGIKKGRETGALTIQDVLPSDSQVAKHQQT